MSEKHLLGIFCKCDLCGEEKAMHFPCEMCDHAHPICPKCLYRFKDLKLVSKPMASLNRIALLVCATEEAVVGGRLMR